MHCTPMHCTAMQCIKTLFNLRASSALQRIGDPWHRWGDCYPLQEIHTYSSYRVQHTYCSCPRCQRYVRWRHHTSPISPNNHHRMSDHSDTLSSNIQHHLSIFIHHKFGIMNSLSVNVFNIVSQYCDHPDGPGCSRDYH